MAAAAKKAIDPTLEFGWEGPRKAKITTRVCRGAADVFEAAAEDLNSPEALPTALALEFVAAIFIKFREPGESLIQFLRRRFSQLT